VPDKPAVETGGEGGEFWEDAGPQFNPESSPETPEPDVPTPEEDLGWTPEGVSLFLSEIQAPAFNAMLNPLLGVQDVDWTHRERRLAAVAPAIAREWNKIPAVRALAGHTDRGIILSYLLLEYLGPRAFEVVQERKARAAEEDQEFLEHEQPMYDGPAAVVPDQPNEAGPRVTGLPARRR
jgi:hypothetical protein